MPYAAIFSSHKMLQRDLSSVNGQGSTTEPKTEDNKRLQSLVTSCTGREDRYSPGRMLLQALTLERARICSQESCRVSFLLRAQIPQHS